MVLLKILQANFQMQFTSTSDNVLTGFGDVCKDARIRLRKTFKTFDQLGQVVGILHLNGALNNRRDRELHDLQVVGGFHSGKGTRLQQELVNTDQTNNVTSRNILDWLNEATHHENGTLNSLDVQIFLLSRSVVGALDADLKTRTDSTGEDTTEGVETTLIGSRHHLGDVKHQRSFGIAVTDTNAGLIIVRTFVESFGTVLLSSDGGWQVKNHHFQKSIGSWKELLHDNLKKGLALQFLLLTGQLNLELLQKNGDFLLLRVGDSIEDLEDGVQNKLVESTLELLALVFGRLGPLLGLGVEEVIALDTKSVLVKRRG